MLKIEGALHINWRKPNLNAQQSHLALTLSLKLLPPLFFSVFVFFRVSLSSIILIMFFCLNYTSLLLHLMRTQLVLHLSLSSIIFITSTLIIGIFYCLNYTSLLLHLITNLVIGFYNNYVNKICPRQLL